MHLSNREYCACVTPCEVTFASTTTSSQFSAAQYCNATECTPNRFLPYRAAGCSASYPDVVGVPYGIAGLCNSIRSSAFACSFPDPPTPVQANINLTGTGLRLVENVGMRFLYNDDYSRGAEFNETSYINSNNDNITADTTTSSNGEVMDITVPFITTTLDNFVGSCRWVTTEDWLIDGVTVETGGTSTRSSAIRTGSGTICVCKETGGSGNVDCDISECTYRGSVFQLHYFTALTATACNFSAEYQVMHTLFCALNHTCMADQLVFAMSAHFIFPVFFLCDFQWITI